MLLLLSLAGYIVLGYHTPRNNIAQLFGLYSGLFAIYAAVLAIWRPSGGILFGAAIAFRLALLFMIPNLSDDYFRFVWDGRLWLNGENPFLHLPAHYLESANQLPGLTQELYNNLNSQAYFTIYPTVCQAVFAFGAWVGGNDLTTSVVAMRSLLILGDIGAIIMLRKLFYEFSMPKHTALIYGLNPLVIMELSGNLHFEGLMVFFLVAAIYLAVKRRLVASALLMALSIHTKLIPLMFLPFFYARMGLGKSLKYYAFTGVFVALLCLPFVNAELAANFWSSLDLYFQRFEFNASFYYIAREIGIATTGWNQIKYLGPGLSLLVVAFVGIYALVERNAFWRNLPERMLISQTVLYFLATTVHPWYLATLVATTGFTRLRYALLWSALALLSYYAYRTDVTTESMWLLAVEYGLVVAWIGYEVRVWWLARKRSR